MWILDGMAFVISKSLPSVCIIGMQLIRLIFVFEIPKSQSIYHPYIQIVYLTINHKSLPRKRTLFSPLHQLLLNRPKLLSQCKHILLLPLIREKRIRPPTSRTTHRITQQFGSKPFTPVDTSLAAGSFRCGDLQL